MHEMSMIQFAAHLGVNVPTVSKLVKAGKIPSAIRSEKGRYKFDPEICTAEYHANKSAAGGHRVRGLNRNESGGYIADPETGMTMNALKVQRMKLDNSMRAHELAKLKGTLVSKSEVEKRLFEIGQLFRVKMQQIPTTVCDDVMAARSRNAVILLLENAIAGALTALADEIEKGI